MTTNIDWKEAWKDPNKVLDIIESNQKLFAMLKTIRNKIKEEGSEKRKVKGKGFIYTKEKITALASEVKDEELSKRLLALNNRPEIPNRDEILGEFNKRLKELSDLIPDSEGKIKAALELSEQTKNASYEVVARILEILREIRDNYKKQIQNIELNHTYEQEVMAASRTGTLSNNLGHFKKEAEKHLERSKENFTLQENTIKGISEIKSLKDKAANLQLDFQRETTALDSIKNKIKEIFYGKQTKPESRKEEVERERELARR